MRKNFLRKISRAAVSDQRQHCRDIGADVILYSPAPPKIISTYQKICDVLVPGSSRKGGRKYISESATVSYSNGSFGFYANCNSNYNLDSGLRREILPFYNQCQLH